MKYTQKLLALFVGVGAFVSASADTLRMNTNSYSNGSNGGSYSVTILSGSAGNAAYAGSVGQFAKLGANSFEGFCLEPGEYFSDNGVYNYSISNVVMGGGNDAHSPGAGDPLSLGTAWLYSQFVQGSLSGFDYSTSGRQAANLDLQKAFWYLEDETQGSLNLGYTNLLVGQFGSVAAAQADAAAGAFGVWALNLTSGVQNETMHQSQLYYQGMPTVPDSGTTAVLLGITLLGLAGFRCRVAR